MSPAIHVPVHPDPSWYAAGLRWIAGLCNSAADFLDTPGPEPLADMPRHISYEEIVGAARNRAHYHGGF